MKSSGAALLRNRSSGNRSPSLSRHHAPPTGRGSLRPAQPHPKNSATATARKTPMGQPEWCLLTVPGRHSDCINDPFKYFHPISTALPSHHRPPSPPPSANLKTSRKIIPMPQVKSISPKCNASRPHNGPGPAGHRTPPGRIKIPRVRASRSRQEEPRKSINLKTAIDPHAKAGLTVCPVVCPALFG